MGGFSMVLINFIFIPTVLLSIVSVILLIISFILKKDMLKRVCGSIILASPGAIYWILLYSFIADTFKIDIMFAGDLAFWILVPIEILLLILIWKKKLTEYLQYSKQTETPPYRSPPDNNGG
ncbi:MAG: hypothetical protein LBM41_04350 [Ruminococcus sp.]|jgi:hypothetical protein|nr:hypothetical protein [Ruminococcus sp.]